MIKNKLIVGITSVLTLMSSTAISYAESADLYFYPKTKWTVSAQPNEAQLCTFQNTMNNGYVLTLSGTRGGISALEINFRQDVFQKEMKYEVQYSVPGKEEAIITARAQHGAVLVSDLKGNPSFGATLLNASTLDVTIRDNAFRVYLTGLDAAREAYNDCLTPQKPYDDIAAQTQENDTQSVNETLASTRNIPETVYKDVIKDNLAPPPPPTVAQNRETLIDTQSTAQRPSFDRPRYTEQLASEVKQRNDLYKVDHETRLVHEEQDQDLLTVDANDVIETQEKDIITEDIASDTIDNQQEQQNNESANAIPIPSIEPEAKVSSNVIVEEEIYAHNTHIDDAALSVAQIEPASNASPAETLDALSHVAREETEHMRQQIRSLTDTVVTLREQNETLKQEIKSRVQETEQERLSVSSDNWNLERATMRFNEAERQILRLGRQLQTQRAQCEQEKASLETMLFDPKLTEQQQLAKLSLLEADLDDKQSEMYRQKRQYEERIKILEERLTAQ